MVPDDETRRRDPYGGGVRVREASPTAWSSVGSYTAGALVAVLCSLFSWFVLGLSQLADVAMVFLLGVTIVSMRFGYGASLVTAVLGAVSFEFFFIPPSFSFAVANLRYIVTFAVMVFVAFVVSHLTKRVRDQADAARDRERRTASLFAMSRDVGLAPSREALVESAARHLRDVFGAKVALLLVGGADRLEPALADPEVSDAWPAERRHAEAALREERVAGLGVDARRARCVYAPLKGSLGCAGVLAVLPQNRATLDDPDQRQLLAAFAGLVGSALERTRLADEARAASLRAETEQLRSALLSSVSHDLRTPLGVVTGATSALLEPDGPKDDRSRRRLLETAHDEAQRLARLVRNLLDMTRLEAGALKVRKEPQSLEEVVGAALTRLEDRLHGREVTTDVQDEAHQVPFDPVLIEVVLINLIENAIKYSPPGAPLEVGARVRDGNAEVEVADRGPGVSADHAPRIFDKFFRVEEREGGGVGLGLAICRGIVAAHGGRIWVDPRPGGGSSFRFTLPLDPAPASASVAAALAATEAE
jgi:two-component system sensor histidine kinase KdpD